MIRCTVINVIFLLVFAESAKVTKTPVIETHNGPVQGKIVRSVANKTYATFRGIPYAKPPIGDLRFKPPVEPAPWSETFQALQEGGVCPQYDFVYEVLTGTEDCLYLNVHTPETQFDKNMELRSVIVFIFGGSFTSGYGNASLYGPDLIVDEDVVLVTFNYRLGAAGFLSLDHVNASGNAGLKDQNLALKWVQKNIRNFGGNPKQVTLFGQSAGGVSVDFHVLSDKSRGLFERSISMSASVLCFWGFFRTDLARMRARALGVALNCDTTDTDKLLSCLMKVPIEDMVEASSRLTLTGLPFLPTLETNPDVPEEDKFITKCSYNEYTNGNFAMQPHMMGFEKNEALRFIKPLTDVVSKLDYFLDMLKELQEWPVLKEALAPSTVLISTIRKTITDAIQVIEKTLTDLLFVAQIDLKQKLLSKRNSYPIYYYNLTYESEYDWHRVFYDIQVNGSAHGDDLGYLFVTTLADIPTDPTQPYNQFRRTMARMWTNFAKFGNPTPHGKNDSLVNFSWPDSRFSELQLVINQNPVVRKLELSIPTSIYQGLVKAAAPYYTECTNLLSNIEKALPFSSTLG